jgi:hypothetical protein
VMRDDRGRRMIFGNDFIKLKSPLKPHSPHNKVP